MPKPKVHIDRDQNYACIQCGRCCRRFHVLLREAEVERLRKIDWGADVDLPDDFVTRIRGTPYFARNESGGCVFLEETSGACIMHRKIGYKRKALTCRGYPMNIASTYWGEVSVIARMDCPAVQGNLGPPITGRRKEIEGLVAELGTEGGFTREQMEGLNRQSIETIVGGLEQLLTGEDTLTPGEQAAALRLASERLRALGSTFLNDTPTLQEVMPSLLNRAREDASQRPGRTIGAFSRALFRVWLATNCRRDEEIVRPSLAHRIRRTAELAKVLCGGGNLQRLGWEHPDISLGRARIFAGPDGDGTKPSRHDAWDCYRRLLLSRLRGPQFFGVSYYGASLFTGLRGLLLSYPLVLAAARIHAVADGHRDIRTPDVEYAVGAIDHCLGRSPLLQFRMWRAVEEHFSGSRFLALLNSLGWE